MQALPKAVREPDLPPRRERIEAVRELLGAPDETVEPLTRAIRASTHRMFRQEVVPLIRAHWPAMERDPFFEKARFLAAHIYATAPYLALLCGASPPWMIKRSVALANRLPLSARRTGQLAAAAISVFTRTMHRDRQRRIMFVASFIAVVDHVFDQCMAEPPEVRGELLKKLIDGVAEPSTPALHLLQALQQKMAGGLSRDEKPHFDAAMNRLKDWVDAEVAGATGREDPSGCAHRIAGVEGTIDGILFPFHRFAGEGARRWMYDASLLIQMIDDYVDYDTDRLRERITPVLTGAWTLADIAAAWQTSRLALERLATDSGLTAPHLQSFALSAYRSIMLEGLEAVAVGIAD